MSKGPEFVNKNTLSIPKGSSSQETVDLAELITAILRQVQPKDITIETVRKKDWVGGTYREIWADVKLPDVEIRFCMRSKESPRGQVQKIDQKENPPQALEGPSTVRLSEPDGDGFGDTWSDL